MMQKMLQLVWKRKISTARVDDMPSQAAHAALNRRLHRMLDHHSSLQVQALEPQKVFSNPLQTPPNP